MIITIIKKISCYICIFITINTWRNNFVLNTRIRWQTGAGIWRV